MKSTISIPEDEPQWTDYEIFKQSQDTLSISIPIKVSADGERSILIANQVKSKQELVYVKLPGSGKDTLPANIRRRVIIDKDGERILYRPVINNDGELKLARIRNSLLKSGGFDGGYLPEVVVYPGSDYNSFWWWWDYIAGIMLLPPPYGQGSSTPNDTRPDYGRVENITKNADVQKAFKTMIQNVKNDASKATGRRERGFWIFYDKATKKYYTGNEKVGPYVKGGAGTKGDAIPGGGSPSLNGSHIPKTAIAVTFVHVHTPLTYEENCRREVGPSEGDINYADGYNIEIIVIDYVGKVDTDGKYYIYGGHSINDPMKEYPYVPTK
ncbi:MAG: hypothetical protein ACK5KL_20685 [Dysgonomonas sp.]